MGDVAMTVPVLYSVANRYPNDKFILLTKDLFLPLFINKPSNLEIYAVHAKDVHKGVKGMRKLISELNEKNIDRVADLHQVLRSIEIDCYFGLKGKKIAVIDKGRADKKALTRKNNKKYTQLESSVERYQKVFEKLGYDASLDFTSLFAEKQKHDGIRIGIAPFAKHAGKIYPVDKTDEVIRLLCEISSVKIFLLGGRDERSRLESLANNRECVELAAGQLSFYDEILLMNSLDVMLSMDSANMHLASLLDVPVVSIWGATHPYAGFYGYNQNPDNAVQVDMPCRPCSVFGNKLCRYGSYDCFNQIKPKMIVEKIMNVISTTGHI
jgi:ADP-heptose:LPS heptosyltransferase